MKGRFSFRPPWMAQPYSFDGRRPGAALASARLAALMFSWLLRFVTAFGPVVEAVRSAAVPAPPVGAMASGDPKPAPAVLAPNGVRNAPGKLTTVWPATWLKFPLATVFGSNWPTWISCAAPDNWAEPQGWSRRRVPTKSGTPLRCATSRKRAMVGKPVTGSKATPTGATAGGLPTNTLAPLLAWPEAGMMPRVPLERPNTPPWLNTVLRR